MSILAVSVSHQTTSVDVLARVAMDQATATKLAQTLLAGDHVDEAVVLSTCNRTEMYASVSRFHGGLDDVTNALAALSGVGVAELRQMCAVYFDEGAVAQPRHERQLVDPLSELADALPPLGLDLAGRGAGLGAAAFPEPREVAHRSVP